MKSVSHRAYFNNLGHPPSVNEGVVASQATSKLKRAVFMYWENGIICHTGVE